MALSCRKPQPLRRAAYLGRGSPFHSLGVTITVTDMGRKKYTFDEVLKLGGEYRYSGTVRNYYRDWRKANALGDRCDTLVCQFHSQPLLWCGRQFPLILDHVSGNRDDNRPENLRFLCPNCDSQNTETRAGANIGKITRFPDGSYHRKRSNGTHDSVLKAPSLQPSTAFGTPSVNREDEASADQGDALYLPDKGF